MTAEPQQSSSSRFLLVAVVLTGIALGIGWAVGKSRSHREESVPSLPVNLPAPPAAMPSQSATDRRGEMVFSVYCASCHGPEGHGDGASAATLKPPPRDFAARPWRFEPTAEVVRRVTLDGIPGTGMASFRNLPPADIDAVVDHVLRLATTGSVVTKPLSAEQQLLASAGFNDLVGIAPPPLALTDAKGQESKLSDFPGRLVLLHFWGTGCTHCIKEIPALDRLEKQHAGRLKVLHVCVDEEDPAAAQKVLDRLVPGSTALTEASGVGLARYEVQALPAVWLIGPDGKAIGRSSGAKDWTAEAQTKLISRWLPHAK